MTRQNRYRLISFSMFALAVFWFFFVASVFTSKDPPWIIGALGFVMFWGMPLLPVLLIISFVCLIKSIESDDESD
jgi:hypothetical protein